MKTKMAVIDVKSGQIDVYEGRDLIASYTIDEDTTPEDIEAARTYREDESFDWVI